MSKEQIISFTKVGTIISSTLAVGTIGSHFMPTKNKLMQLTYALGVGLISVPVIEKTVDHWVGIVFNAIPDEEVNLEEKSDG